ncbi:hypothetical protein ETW23_15175 [Leisingera sp. NJS201]|nr:hypothetical protein ETW23_15175 [Leisingera sp. NJS201]
MECLAMFEFKNMFNSNAKKTALSVLCSFSLLTGASVTQAHAQRPEKEAPGFSPFSKRIHFYRFFEDYSDVTDQDRQGDWFAKVKSIPVPGFEGARVALGGEFRYRFENMNDGLFGLVPGQDYDLKLQRYLLHADVRWNDRLRSFFQLSAYYAQGEPAVLRSLNESDADIHQTFVDIGSREKFVRIGRQELPIGSGLNTTIREGVNQRRAFDAVLASVDFGSGSNFTWVYGREVVPMAASFEDYSEDGTEFWTAYFSRIANPWPTANVDIYYMGIDRPNAIYNSGRAVNCGTPSAGEFTAKKVLCPMGLKPCINSASSKGRTSGPGVCGHRTAINFLRHL